MAAGLEDTEVGRAKFPTTDHFSPSIGPPNFFSLSRKWLGLLVTNGQQCRRNPTLSDFQGDWLARKPGSQRASMMSMNSRPKKCADQGSHSV